MAQVTLVEPTALRTTSSSLLCKSACVVEQVTAIELEEDELGGAAVMVTVDRCQETLSRALQMQMDIQDSIETLRERKAERLDTLSASLRELEQSQTVTLLILGMLNRRVLYEYPSVLAINCSDDDSAIDLFGTFAEEIALVRKTLADVAIAEKRAETALTHDIAQVLSVQNDVDELSTDFESLMTEWNNECATHMTALGAQQIMDQIRCALDGLDWRGKQVAEAEKIYTERILSLTEPVWDVCAEIKEMCDLLELDDFETVKDTFLRKMLIFAYRMPVQWPQALNFRNEVRSDIRCNLGLDKYGELRWHRF